MCRPLYGTESGKRQRLDRSSVSFVGGTAVCTETATTLCLYTRIHCLGNKSSTCSSLWSLRDCAQGLLSLPFSPVGRRGISLLFFSSHTRHARYGKVTLCHRSSEAFHFLLQFLFSQHLTVEERKRLYLLGNPNSIVDETVQVGISPYQIGLFLAVYLVVQHLSVRSLFPHCYTDVQASRYRYVYRIGDEVKTNARG